MARLVLWQHGTNMVLLTEEIKRHLGNPSPMASFHPNEKLIRRRDPSSLEYNFDKLTLVAIIFSWPPSPQNKVERLGGAGNLQLCPRGRGTTEAGVFYNNMCSPYQLDVQLCFRGNY